MEIKILIVEDVPTDAKFLELEVLKYNADADIQVTNSIEGLKASLNDFRPNVILSDFDLRSFTAFEVLEILKNHTTSIPCIIVTGVINDEETVARLVLNGAVGFIQKKDLSHIRLSLRRVLENLDHSFSSNFETYEGKLKMLFKLREMQFDLKRLSLDLPELGEFQGEFSTFAEEMMIDIQKSYEGLPLLKR